MGLISWKNLRIPLLAVLVSQLASPFGVIEKINISNNQKPLTNLNSRNNNASNLAKLGLKEADLTTKKLINENYGKLPLRFEKNIGQVDNSIDFISHNSEYSLFISPTKTTFDFNDVQNQINLKTNPKVNIQNAKVDDKAQLTMQLVGANQQAKCTKLDKLETKSNYLIGNNQNHWKENIENFAKVQYQNIYDGIDIVYYGNQKQLEYDLIVSPHINPNIINISFPDAEKLTIDNQGNLVINVNNKEISKKKPYIYQEVNGNKQEVVGNYIIKENNQIGFNIEAYDVNKPLVIDPTIGYSTYLGGTDSDFSSAIAVDKSGNTYVVGYTKSLNFPTSNPQQKSLSGKTDLFVAKLNPTGTALSYSTYIGGSEDDFGNSISVDSNGNVYIAGYTFSKNFPIANPFQSQNGNTIPNTGGDSFVLKLNQQGNALAYSSYLGGMGDDMATSIAVDLQGNTYVTGFTDSINFPIANAIQNKSNGGFDAFVTKINANGNSLSYSTYFGGSDNDFANSIAIDKDNNAYIVGVTDSRNLSVTNPLQSTIAGDSDGFIVKVGASGNSINFATYLGGSNFDSITSVTVDNTNNIYVTGLTNSTDFTVVNPIQKNIAGSLDAFVSKLNPAGNNLIYSTYLGGTIDEQANSIALDAMNNVYIMGVTTSTDFPVANPTQKSNAGGQDAFMTEINSAGNALIFSTYLGGTNNDTGLSLVVDTKGNVFMTGVTNSMDFPMSKPLQAACGCDPINKINDAFVTSFLAPAPPTPDFSIGFAQNQIMLARGKQLDITVTITRTGGFTGNVTITPDADRAKILKLLFTPTSQSTTGNSTTFSIKAKKKSPVGTSPIVFTAKDSNGKTKTAMLNVIIQ